MNSLFTFASQRKFEQQASIIFFDEGPKMLDILVLAILLCTARAGICHRGKELKRTRTTPIAIVAAALGMGNGVGLLVWQII